MGADPGRMAGQPHGPLRAMFVTCENTDDLPYIVQETGEDGLVIGTDYGIQ